MQTFRKVVADCLDRLTRKTVELEGSEKQTQACCSARRLLGFCLLCTGSLCISTMTLANSVTGTDGKPVSAALNFTIIIPAVLRMMENTHPSSLPIPQSSTTQIEAQQRIVVLSTLRRGFCMDLRLNQAQVASWQLQVSGSKSSWVEAVVGGYRLCIGRAGRYELALQHEFGLKQASPAEATHQPALLALNWPVNVSMVTP